MAHSHRPELDGVRALAVSLVVLHHVGVVPGGFVGVDVFFTLSGYLITHTLPATTLRRFYVRRAFRLLPALFATLAAALALFPSPPVAASALCAALSLSNLYFYKHVSYFNADALAKPLLHTWSLSVEEQFYLVYPCLHRLVPPRLRAPSLLLLMLASFARAHLLLPSDPSAAFYLPHLRAWQFLLGALVAILHPAPLLHARLPALVPPNLAVLLALALILYPALRYTPLTPFPALAALPPALATALLLLFAHRSSLAAATLAAPAPAFLGRISYSVYLIHWPLVVAIPSLHALSLVPRLLIALATLPLGCVLYRVIESPYRIRGPGTATLPIAHPFKPLTLLALFFLVATVIATGGRLVWTPPAQTDADTRDWVDGIMRGARLAAIPNDSRRLAAAAPQQDLLAKQVGAIGAPGAPRLLVLGDSHAGRLLPFAGYLGAKYRLAWHVSSYPGCSPLFGVSKSRVSVGVGQGRVSDEHLAFCETLVETWRRWSTGGDFGIVFLVSRWSTSVEAGEYFSRGPLAEYRLRETGTGAALAAGGVNESRAVFERALRRTVREIARGGSRVVIVSEVPDIGRGSYQCKRWLERWARGERRVSGGQPGVCTGATRKLAMGRLAFTDRVIREVAHEVQGAESIVPSAYFCDNQRQDARHCRVVWKHRMLYRDSDHLSEYGALYLALRWEADRSAYFPRGWKVA